MVNNMERFYSDIVIVPKIEYEDYSLPMFIPDGTMTARQKRRHEATRKKKGRN
jgi:hypothetical protein